MLDQISQLKASPLSYTYCSVRQTSERLIQPLSAEDCCVQSMPDVSPSKWHLAHTTWFFETFVLKPFYSQYKAANPEYEYLFNSYYNGVGKQYPRPQRFLLTRPSLEEVLQYRSRVDQAIGELINSPAINQLELQQRITLGLNHEQQHQELLLTDIKHVLSHNPLYPVYQKSTESRDRTVESLEFLYKHSDQFECGYSGEGFSFDNESPYHKVHLLEHQLSNRLITNSEFLAFIEDKGYQRPELWLSDGWSHINEHQWCHPLYWVKQDQQWFEYTLNGLEPLNNNKPVCHLSLYEADAFARWQGCRLPTEYELESALKNETVSGNFVESKQFHPSAAEGNKQLYGDCWEWTQSSYAPYPRFKPAAGAIGEYNGKFMCNQMVLRGGSCLTPQDHIRSSYRNFFYPHQRWQMMGLRLAKDVD